MEDVPSPPHGATTRAIRQVILKLHGRCNLACDYCYVYTMADQRWRARPSFMSAATVEQVAVRIAEHVRVHDLNEVEVVLHGGEPLLAGSARIEHCVATLRAAVPDRTVLAVTVQTNGTLLGSALPLLRRLGVRVGVSLDGERSAHDRRRRRPNGSGSFDSVDGALRELGDPRFRHLFAGLLCTVDLRNDPTTTYEALLRYRPPMVDFLLPHGNWTAPPPGRRPNSSATPYADWLRVVFERWYAAEVVETRVRLFEELMNLVLGGRSRLEGVGLSPTAMLVVETDGSIEQSDVLASAYAGAAATGLHVSRDPFDRTPTTRDRLDGLSVACLRCPVHRVCGGGLLAHRYSEGEGFANPSVYCPDLYALITHMRDRLTDDLAVLRSG